MYTNFYRTLLQALIKLTQHNSCVCLSFSSILVQNLQTFPISQTNCFVIKLNSGQKHVTFFICSFQPQLPQSDCSRKGTRKICTAYCRARHSHPLKIISFDNSTISRHLNNFFPQQSLIKNFTIYYFPIFMNFLAIFNYNIVIH